MNKQWKLIAKRKQKPNVHGNNHIIKEFRSDQTFNGEKTVKSRVSLFTNKQRLFINLSHDFIG